MKHTVCIVNLLLPLLMAFSAAAGLSAQEYTPVPVTISKEKARVDGKVYYSHIVLERQTLYSICKAYNVTMEQIFEANPSVKEEGLKKNSILLIPCPDRKQETVVTAADTSQSGGKAGKKQKIHTVKWYEDLDAIADRYGVSVESIMKANGLTGRKLSKRQKLVIPEPGQIFPEEEAAADTVAAADTLPAGEGPANAAALLPDRTEKVEAVLLLPFNASGEKPRNGSIDFYNGALMAVKQLGDSGTDIDLSVYDVEGGILPVTTERLEKSDIVIGPVSAGDLSRLMEKCPETTCIVSPLDHKAEYLENGHPNFIQAPSSNLTIYEDLAEWIKEERGDSDEKVIIIHEKGARNIEETGAMNTILEKDGIPFSSFSYSILEGRDVQEPLKAMMDSCSVNRILVMSESEAFVNDVVRNLNLLIHGGYGVILYGASKIRSFETIEVDNLHHTQLHTSLAYYVDYENPSVRDFVRKYRALYNTEPTPYAFQGYDVTLYFLQLCATYGKDWAKHLENSGKAMLQTDFRFRKAGENDGYVNTGVRRIIYGEGYSIRLAD